MELKPGLSFNCPENWDKMRIGLVSRYCENCKRDIHDFTGMSRIEILQTLLANRNTKVCGRIFKSQLDYHHREILVMINAYIRNHRNSNLSFYLISLGAMVLLSCSTNTEELNTRQKDSLTILLNGSEASNNEDTIGMETSLCTSKLLPQDDVVLLGAIVAHDSSAMTENGVRMFAEIMPEFPGGFDSLTAYIKKSLKYPDLERKAGIEGNVFVSFTVNAEGKIVDPKILRSVAGSKYFDAEVLRLVSEMPDWVSGQERGQNVPVQMVLPIKFKL